MAWGRWRQVSRPPHALITPGARLPLAAVVLLCVAVVAALGVHYAGHTAAGPLDAHVDAWVQGRLGISSVPLTVLTWLGDQAEVTVITIAATLGCLLARWWRGAVLALLAAPVSALLTEDIFKPLIGRAIGGLKIGPSGHVVSVAALSMPSGHATAVFTLATLAAVLLSRWRRPARYPIIVAAYALAAAVAAAMIAQHFHYFTDIISGTAMGVGTVLTSALAIDALASPVWARVSRLAGLHPRTSPGPN